VSEIFRATCLFFNHWSLWLFFVLCFLFFAPCYERLLCMAKTRKKKMTRRRIFAKVPTHQAPSNMTSKTHWKDLINAGLADLWSEGGTFLVLEDPKKGGRTTEAILRCNLEAKVVIVSSDEDVHTLQEQFPGKSVVTICGFTTRVLMSAAKKFKHLFTGMFLDYCGNAARTDPDFDWVADLRLVTEELLAPGGMVFATFAQRNMPFSPTFVATTIRREVPAAFVADLFGYRDSSTMLLVQVAVKKDWPHVAAPPPVITDRIVPIRGGRVLVKDDSSRDGWEGTFKRRVSSNEWEVEDETGELWLVFPKEVTRLSAR